MTDEERREPRDEERRDEADIEEGACCGVEIRDPGNRDIDYEAAQRTNQGDYTSESTGGFPVGEQVEIAYSIPDDLPGDEADEMQSEDRMRPGTIDDVPYSYGEDREYKPALEPLATGDEERDLWREQQQLIDEDRKTSLHLDGFPDREIPDVLDAIGDDAAEDSSGETLEARTSVYSPEHGGFPTRPETAGAGGEAPTEGGAERTEPDTEGGSETQAGGSEPERSK